MNLRNRQRLLAIARLLDRRAAAIRSYVKASTPKRKRSDSPSEAQQLKEPA